MMRNRHFGWTWLLIVGLWGSVLPPTLCDAAVLCAQKKSGRMALRATACKPKETPVDLAQFGVGQVADGAVTDPKIADGAVSGSKIGDGAVGSAKIANGAVGDDQIQDRPATIVLPAEAIGSNANVTRTFAGLSFPATFMAAANVILPLPQDWDGQSTFRVTIYFTPDTGAAGVVAFFLRPTGRKFGEALGDPGSVSAPGVNVPATSQLMLFTQTFEVPANRVEADDDVFHLYGIQRGGTGETFADPVTLRVVEISYTARR